MANESVSPQANPLLVSLNPAQRQAVTCVEGPLLVLAGPGSGKTRVITHRVAYLVQQGIPPDAILAITFTNKAANEMRQRIEKLLGLTTPWISTFHSFAARLLRRHIYRLEPFTAAFTIYDADDSLGLLTECLKELDVATTVLTPRQVQAKISHLKNSGVEDPESLPQNSGLGDRVIRDVFSAYTRALVERNALDFDDLLLFLERLFKTQPDLLERYRQQFQFVLIDEYQDTNQIQYRTGRLLSIKHRNLCVTGDPDQAIYSWRGADVQNILSFERDFADARVVRLEQNYRSTRSILSVANSVICHNYERKQKELWTENAEGDPVRVYCFSNGEEEANDIADLIVRLRMESIPSNEIAVFYRVNSLSREIERALVMHGIPYAIVGAVEFYQRKEVKDVLAYLRLLANPRDSESLRRIINVPPRWIGKKTVERVFEIASEEGVSPLVAILRDDLRRRAGKGQMAKGLERFANIYNTLAAEPKAPVSDLVRRVIDLIEYEEYLQERYADEYEERWPNVREFVNAAQQHDDSRDSGDLQTFLEEVALLAGVDRWDDRADRVSLMTLHSAKGLEFSAVIIAANEEGLLPLIRKDADFPSDPEEERRLFYVGVTRAKEKVFLTHAKSRRRFGSLMPCVPSSFLRELTQRAPDARLEIDAETQAILSGSRRSFWDLDDTDSGIEVSRRRQRSTVDEASFAVDDWDEEVLDEDPYPPGARVLHPDYGEGVVVRSVGLGRRRRLVIDFESAGTKNLVLGFARLRRL